MKGLRITALPPSNRPSSKSTNWQEFFTRDITWGSRHLGDKQKEGLYQELGLLLGAGVDIKSALDLQVQQQKGSAQNLLTTIRDTVVRGSSLSDALRATDQFTAYEYHSVRIGEETGRLVSILAELAAYHTRKIRQRRQVTQALAYPIVVLTTALGAVLFMLNFIVPMFSDVFRQFGGQLPPLTQAIVRLSAIMRSYWIISAFLLVSIILLQRLVRKSPIYQRISSSLLLRLPIIGGIIRSVYLARLCSSLALLSGAHVPLIQALSLARKMLGFWPIEQALYVVEQKVMQGAFLHRTLQQFPIFDARMIALLKVGEEVNKLDHFFGILAQQYSEEVEHQTALLSTALEPLIILFLGAVVGIILVAMYLPIFQMSSAIG